MASSDMLHDIQYRVKTKCSVQNGVGQVLVLDVEVLHGHRLGALLALN